MTALLRIFGVFHNPGDIPVLIITFIFTASRANPPCISLLLCMLEVSGISPLDSGC